MYRVILIIFLVAISTHSQSADMILMHGKMWTGVKEHPWAEAVAIQGDRILDIGTDQEIGRLIQKQTHVIDLHQQLVLPGLIDDHTHFLSGGFQLLSVNLRDANTP